MNAPVIELLGLVSNQAQTRQPGTAVDLFSVLLGNMAAGLGKGVATTTPEGLIPIQAGPTKTAAPMVPAVAQADETALAQTLATQATATQDAAQQAAQQAVTLAAQPAATAQPEGQVQTVDPQQQNDPDEAAVSAALGLTPPTPVQPQVEVLPVPTQAATPVVPQEVAPAPPVPAANPGEAPLPITLPPAADASDQPAQTQQTQPPAAKPEAAPLPANISAAGSPTSATPTRAPQSPSQSQPQPQQAANPAPAQSSEPKPAPTAANAPQTAPTELTKPAVAASNAATQRPARDITPEPPRVLRPAPTRAIARTSTGQTAAAQAKQLGTDMVALQRTSAGGPPQTPAALADRLAAMTTMPSHDPMASTLNLAGADKLAAAPQTLAEGTLPQLQQAGANTAGHDAQAGSHTPRGIPAPAAQIAVHLQRALNGQTQRFSIRLEPAELGRVDVQLAFHRNGSVRATIAAERAETLDLLQKDSQGLERALKDLGADPNKLELSFNLSSEQQQGGETRDGGFRGDFATVDGEPSMTTAIADEALPAYTRVDGLVDLMI